MQTEPCSFMDDNECLGAQQSHTRHSAQADLSKPVVWEDGDEKREGHICVICGHVVAAYPHHTDPRLDAKADDWGIPVDDYADLDQSFYGPVTSDEDNFGGIA